MAGGFMIIGCNLPLLLFCSLLFSGFLVNATIRPYDYSYNNQCLHTPDRPLYGGGIVVNPEFNHGLKGWKAYGNLTVESRVSGSGNRFGVSHPRYGNNINSNAGLSQEFFLDKEKLYTFSAWVQISRGEAEVLALFDRPTGSFTRAAEATAKFGCWTMLKGGLTVNVTGPANLFFKSYDASIEIMVDSVSLQPFTQEEWKSHQQEIITKVRKSKVKIQAVDALGKPLANKALSISQKSATFPLGCAMNKAIVVNEAYQNWFASRFKYTTFENEMKWYENEVTRNVENYTISDAMLEFTQKHNISVRAHAVFWNTVFMNVEWVRSLSPSELQAATQKRIFSVMNKYKGKVIAWDVVNENLHYDYFESKLGANASTDFYKTAHMLDPETPLFLNEFNTIEEARDDSAYPTKYLARIAHMRAQGYHGPLSIGLQSHFLNTSLNLPYMRSAIDILASAGLSIWITEIDAQPRIAFGDGHDPLQAETFEKTLRESYAHPAIQGMIIWGPWSPTGQCFSMCLTDYNFKNLPAGDVVDKILAEWEHTNLTATTDATGFFETSLTLGDYEAKLGGSAINFKVVPASSSPSKIIQTVKIQA